MREVQAEEAAAVHKGHRVARRHDPARLVGALDALEALGAFGGSRAAHSNERATHRSAWARLVRQASGSTT